MRRRPRRTGRRTGRGPAALLGRRGTTSSSRPKSEGIFGSLMPLLTAVLVAMLASYHQDHHRGASGGGGGGNVGFFVSAQDILEGDPVEQPELEEEPAAAQDVQQGQCTIPKLIPPQSPSSGSSPGSSSESMSPKPYQIGVLAIRGFDSAYAEFNATFSTYLTLTAGRRFSPPISFQLRPLNFIALFDDVKSQPPAVDFIYVNPSAYACIESEFSAHSLVSQISNRKVAGQSYDLTKFGGVIAVRADNDDINTIEDIPGRTVAAASISGLGSGQMQFRELERAGISYVNAPRQLVFTSNQGKVVNGVLDGQFDVGFVRTDQIERTKDPETGELIDPARLKVIQPQPDLAIDGVPFPFESSTPLYPEWNLASLSHVSDDVASEVQSAMRALEAHASVGYDILGCYDACGGEEDGAGVGIVEEADAAALEECRATCRDDADLSAGGRCDTTVELALAAAEAKTNGKYTGWRSTLSYMELRNMQEETNFIRRNETSGKMQCIRSSNIYDAIVCPPGHFRRREEEVLAGCDMAGLPCADGFQCLCRPCVQSFDVDVFPVYGDGSIAYMASTSTRRGLSEVEDGEDEDGPVGCAKMALCGRTEQTKPIRFRAIDNKKRSGMDLVVYVHAGQSETREVSASPVRPPGSDESAETFMYEFEIAEPRVGVVVLEILANGEQIPESPLRLEVVERNCASDNNDPLSVAEDDGSCSCEANSVNIGGTCVSYAILLPAIIIPIVGILAVAIFIYVKRKHKAADSVWHVKEKELTFDDPPEVIGRGTFGLVLLAEYRGTQVAVKRVIPPKQSKHGTSSTSMTKGTASAAVGKRYSFLPAYRSSIATAPRQASLDPDLEGIAEEGSAADDQSHHDKADESKGSSSLTIPHGRRRSSGFSMPMKRNSAGNLSEEEKSKRRSSYKYFDMSDDDPELGNLQRRKSAGSFGSMNNNSSGFDSFERKGSGALASQSGAISSSSLFASSQVIATNGRGNTSQIVMQRKQSSSGHRSGSASDSSKGWGKRIRQSLGLESKDEYAKLKADFIVEMRHLSKLRHPCITTVMGAVIEKGVEPMLIMEYMDMGSLHDILHNESFPLDGDLLLPILRDIAQGVRFLHAAKPQVIHGDLKAHNVLVDGKFRAKVADFGLSAKKIIGATGTPLWMAPELLRGESRNTAASDVYSFGIILYEVYSRKDPYEGEDLSAVLRDVTDPKINKRPPVPESCPAKIAAIMTDCLVGNPNDRPTVEEIDLRLKRLSVENVEPGEMHLSHQARKHLDARRGEDLISKMFPKHIADQLRQGRKPEPENKEMVTIFFSDVVGFTDLSSKMEPEKVSDMLDRLYLRFDVLADKHDVFKIETIGDAFIGVTNLVKDQEDHAKRIAEFAVDAVAAAEQTQVSLDDPSLGHVVIRVGFHSGPVIASVVGSRLPKYTILGDTVNTAARMESNSLPGRIQCTERSARLLVKQCPNIPISPRGEISIKGKGEMATFWVNEAPAASKKHLLPVADKSQRSLELTKPVAGKSQRYLEKSKPVGGKSTRSFKVTKSPAIPIEEAPAASPAADAPAAAQDVETGNQEP